MTAQPVRLMEYELLATFVGLHVEGAERAREQAESTTPAGETRGRPEGVGPAAGLAGSAALAEAIQAEVGGGGWASDRVRAPFARLPATGQEGRRPARQGGGTSRREVGVERMMDQLRTLEQYVSRAREGQGPRGDDRAPRRRPEREVIPDPDAPRDRVGPMGLLEGDRRNVMWPPPAGRALTLASFVPGLAPRSLVAADAPLAPRFVAALAPAPLDRIGGEITAVAFSGIVRGNALAAAGNAEGEVVVRRYTGAGRPYSLGKLGERIDSLAFSRNAEWLAVGVLQEDESSVVKVYRVRTLLDASPSGPVLRYATPAEENNLIATISFSQDGRFFSTSLGIAAGGGPSGATVYETAPGRQVFRRIVRGMPVSATLNGDGSRLIMSTYDGDNDIVRYQLIDTASGKVLFASAPNAIRGTRFQLSPNGTSFLGWGGSDNRLAFLESATGRILRTIETQSYTAATFDARGQRIVLGNSEGAAWAIDLEGRLVDKPQPLTPGKAITQIAIDPFNRRYMIAGEAGTARPGNAPRRWRLTGFGPE